MTTRAPGESQTESRLERFQAWASDRCCLKSRQIDSPVSWRPSQERHTAARPIAIIACILQKEVDDLFPIAETLQMLVSLTSEAATFPNRGRTGLRRSEIDERKRLFRRHLLAYVPLAGRIRRVLDERASHTLPKSRFLDELEDYMTAEAAERTLHAVIDWGRYAEAFAYDDDMATFGLENPT